MYVGWVIGLYLFSGGQIHAVTLPTATSYHNFMSWDAPASSPDPVVGYNVYRTLSGGSSYTLLNDTTLTATSYADTSQLEYSITYNYYVESVDAEGITSGPSNTLIISIPFVPYIPVLGSISSV
jgi:fibronectin type 3 domain-containing protein